MHDQPARNADEQWDQTRQRESPDLTGGVPETLSAQEAARLLGIHERTVRRAIRSGELTATKQGGSFHIKGEDLERYRQRRVRPLRHHIGMRPQAHALPASPTSFIGREDVVAEVSALLRRHDMRLVTLTGPGGTGKTRLALRVAANCAAGFVDGAAFVPLAPVHQADLVVPTIAQVLGVRETEDQSPQERLRSFLRDRELLLVLDNLEQIPEAGPALGDLLGACPRLTILATSRAPLRLAGERVYRVPPLALPPRRTAVGGASELPPFDQLARTEAIQLFVERAAAASGEFDLTAGNAPAVAAICERVDGLPLAIELAAARSRVLMPADLLGRLSPQLPLLAGGPADQPARLRSMTDAITWSHDLLTPAEQRLFRRLAVFVGGFSLEAAESVEGRSVTPSVLDTLTALVDQSLVQRVAGPGHETRFSMLETVREFGLERLAGSGEEALVRDAHADWCLDFAERAWPELAGPRQETWFERLEAEHPNLRAALGWLRERGDGERGLLLASRLSWFWSSRGYLREARVWIEGFLGMPTSARTRGDGLQQAGTILQWQGDDKRAQAYNEEALRIFRELGDQLNTAYALRQGASIAVDRGDHERAAALLADSSGVLLAVGIAWDRPFILYMAGRIAAVAGKYAEAMSRFAEAAAGFREVGDHSYVAAALSQQGAAAVRSGDLRTARGAYAAALELAHERNEPIWVASSLAGAAHVAHAAGEPAAAARLLGASAAIRETIGERAEADEAGSPAIREALGEERFAELWRHGMDLHELEAIAEARAILSGSASSRRARSSRRERLRQSLPLTAREREVLRLVVEGLSDKEIAAVLGISHATASDHVASIRAKLGVPSRAAASVLAVRSGLLSS